MNIVAIIPARGNSKGIPKKNIKLLAGKPLIAYAIGAALKSRLISRVIVSTDDKEIARIAKKYGAEIPFMRPHKLATDKVTTLPVLQHAVNYLEGKDKQRIDIVVLIQPTVPLVLSQDIDKAIERLIETNANSCVSVCEISERPEWMYFLENNKVRPFSRSRIEKTQRQDFPRLFRLNGAIYVTKRDILINKNKILDTDNSMAIIMPGERSVDIDKPIDIQIAEVLIKQKSRPET